MNVPMSWPTLAVVLAGVYAGMFLPAPAHAQQSDRAAAYARVAKFCTAETERFCPELASSAPQPRSQAICLRPYQSSLSLGCRNAVKAVSH